MIGRELGSMMIEDRVIQVIETEATKTVDNRADFLATVAGADFSAFIGSVIVTEWWALVGAEKQPIAYASLVAADADSPEVSLLVIVHPDFRGRGVGKFMTRFATDQAIRFRKRSIVCKVEPSSPIVRTLMDEEFDPDPSRRAFRKVLKWREEHGRVTGDL
jgi:ribosomal protein S18 acetylase RimI-like enzyme